MAISTNVLVSTLLGLGLTGVVSLIIWLSFLTQNKDNGSEIQKQLAIVTSVTGILVLVFGGAAYMYFTTDVNALTPFLLVMTFVNMLLSLVAVSTASLNVVYA